MATTEMNCLASGGGGTLEYVREIVALNGSNSYTFTDDYDVILVVSSNVGSSYKPTYNGVTYDYVTGNQGIGAVALIQHIKSGTSITFSDNIACSIHGYDYI